MVVATPVMRLALLCIGLTIARARALDNDEHVIATQVLKRLERALAQDEQGELLRLSNFKRWDGVDVDAFDGSIASPSEEGYDEVSHRHKPFPIGPKALPPGLDKRLYDYVFSAEGELITPTDEDDVIDYDHLWPATIELEAQLETEGYESSSFSIRSRSPDGRRHGPKRPHYSVAFVVFGGAAVYGMLKSIEAAITRRRRSQRQKEWQCNQEKLIATLPSITVQPPTGDKKVSFSDDSSIRVFEKESFDYVDEKDVEAAPAAGQTDDRRFMVKQCAEDMQMDDGWS